MRVGLVREFARTYNWLTMRTRYIVMGKSRVAPLKPMIIPRLELSAAVVLVKVVACYTRNLTTTTCVLDQ